MEPFHVLLVDDEKEFATTLSERLEIRGLKVSVAFNGNDALRWMEEKRFDVIVADVRMPGFSGLDLLRHIKSRKIGTPVILLSGYSALQEAIEGMHLGAFDYLIKPVDIEQLMEKMREAVENKSSGG
ncbi:MAG: response regulator [Desulfosoma sp.]